ncbi:hypothetical protein GF324_10135 [bacterium]|nr:hypothetical protein [bacterium]
MYKTLLAAAILNLLSALVHTFVGGPEVMTPFRALEFNLENKAILHTVWHLVTITLFFTTAVFFLITLRPDRYATEQLAAVMSLPYVLFALLFVLMSIVYGVFLIQWVLLLPVGVVGLIGAKQIGRRNRAS